MNNQNDLLDQPHLSDALLHLGSEEVINRNGLIDQSVDEYVMALETVNRLTTTFRIGATLMLLVGAWETLLTAKYESDGKTGKPHRNPMEWLINNVIPNGDERDNMKAVNQLRNQRAVHGLLGNPAPSIMELLQANFLNYHSLLERWFGDSVRKRFPLGMMAIVYDPEMFSSGNPVETLSIAHNQNSDWLQKFCDGLQEQHRENGKSPKFMARMNLTLAISGENQGGAMNNTVWIGPSTTHPYRQKDVVERLNLLLPEMEGKINSHHIKTINHIYKIREQRSFYYRDEDAYPPRYTQEYINWIVKQYKQNPDWFSETNAAYKTVRMEKRA